MTMIESIRNYFSMCPVLDKYRKALEDAGNEDLFTIKPFAAEEVIKRYADGSSVRQIEFVFSSEDYLSSETLKCIEDSGFFEELGKWFEKSIKEKVLPEMEEQKTAKRIIPVTQHYLFNEEKSKAIYQVQCKLLYFQQA